MDPQTTELLQSIAHSLQRIAAAVEPKEALGFGVEGEVGIDCYPDGNGALWSIYNGQDSPKTPIVTNSFEGYLIGAYTYRKESDKYGDLWKLRVIVQGDRRYRLEAGLLTASRTHHYNNFAGSLLSALDAMTDDQLVQKFQLWLKAGDEPNAVFCNLYDRNGSPITKKQAEPSEGDHTRIITRVNTVLSYTIPDRFLSPADRIKKALESKGVPANEIVATAKQLLGGRKSSDLAWDELKEILNRIERLNAN